MFVYSLTFDDGAVYVGRTARGVHVRLLEHIRDARNGRGTCALHDRLEAGDRPRADVLWEGPCRLLECLEQEGLFIASISPSLNEETNPGGGNLWSVRNRVTHPRPKRQRRKIAESVRRFHRERAA